MQAVQRHVLTFDKRPLVKSVLGEISEGVQSDVNVSREIRRGLEEFAKHGGVRLILDLQVMGPSLEGSPASVRNVSAFLAGEVLIVTGQVTSHWMLRILQAKAESCRRFFPERLLTSLGALISNAVVDAEIALHGIASPIRLTKAILVRVRAR